jgi:acyl-CoA dehydrogenase
MSFAVLSRPLPKDPNFFQDEPALDSLLPHLMPEKVWQWLRPQLVSMGAAAAREVPPLADIANRDVPKLVPYDRFGQRIDYVEYHPTYREMEKIAYGSGIVWMKYDPKVRATLGTLHVASFALTYLFGQGEQGLLCPLCMTDGVARVLEKWGSPALKDQFIPRLASRDMSRLWRGAMFLTERQGGSDVGANATKAVSDGKDWRLVGEKWFCSNVDAEAILTLARVPGGEEGTKGLGLFLVPRDLPDGTRNALHIRRLKDKLGTRSMPTGEVEMDGALAFLVGEANQGFKAMTTMINLSRLYNSVVSVAGMRRAFYEASTYLDARNTFGKKASEHPLAKEALANLAAEQLGAMHLVFRAAHHLDRADAGGATDDALVRILTPMIKYHTAKLAVWATSESIELLGGNGYIEDFITARLYRDAQVLPVWEGTTNILVLDTLRAAMKKQAHEVLFAEIDRRLDAVCEPVLADVAEVARSLVKAAKSDLAGMMEKFDESAEAGAKKATDRMILAYELALLLEDAERAGSGAAAAAERIIDRASGIVPAQ